MTFPGDQEPPRHVWYRLEEALELLAVLEDSLMAVEAQVRDLSRRLAHQPDGGSHAH